MATTLSQYDSNTITNQSFDYNSTNPSNSSTSHHEQFSTSSMKRNNTGVKNEKSEYTPSGQGASQTSTTSSLSSSNAKNKSDNQSQASLQQASIIQNASIGYPLLPAPYISSYYQSLTNANNQSAASYYQNNSSTTNSMSNSSNQNGASNNRRGGKKKAPQTQSSSQEFRAFFNLRKKDHVANVRGQQQMYKPKNSAFISEWFRRLSVQERVNALTTIYPHLTDILIHMNKRIEQSGCFHSFALKDPTCYDHKQISPFSQYVASSYAPSHTSASSFLTGSSSSSISSFEENFYCREQNETEMRTIRSSEKDKFNAEQEIIKHVRFTDYDKYLDTLSVSIELVQDPDNFFKLMSYASGNQAFQSPCSFQFDQKAQVNIIEQPGWFKPKSFNSFATWVVVALEETLWAHYNYAFNENLSSAKTNELVQLFKEKSETVGSDVASETLAQFWKQIVPASKKQLVDQLREKAQKISRDGVKPQGSMGQTILQRSMQSRDSGYHHHIQIVEFGQGSGGKNSESTDGDESHQDAELKEIVDMSAVPGKEQEMIEFLTNTPLSRAEKRQDRICRELFKLIKQRYQEDLVEILLKEELQNKHSTKQSKKKKKTFGNTGGQQTSQNPVQEQQQQHQQQTQQTEQQQQNPTDEQVVAKKKKKNKKQGSSIQNQSAKLVPVQSDSQTSTAFTSNGNIQSSSTVKKKKKACGIQSEKINNSKDHYSCDESTSQEPITHGLVQLPTIKKDVAGKFSVDSRISANANNESITGSTESIKTSEMSQTQDLLLTASKSVDIKSSTLPKAKHTSKTDSKNGNQAFKSTKQDAYLSDEEYIQNRTLNNLVNENDTQLKVNKHDEKEIRKQISELLSSLIDQVCQKGLLYETNASGRVSQKVIHSNEPKQQIFDKQSTVNSTTHHSTKTAQNKQTKLKTYQEPTASTHDNAQSQSQISYVAKDKSTADDEKQTKSTAHQQQQVYHEQSQKQGSHSYKNQGNKQYQQSRQQQHKYNTNTTNIKQGVNNNNCQEKEEPVIESVAQTQVETASQPTSNQQHIQKRASGIEQEVNDDTTSQLSFGQASETTVNDKEIGGTSQMGVSRKKRNRKKGKMNDMQIINNFMKNLQTSEEPELDVQSQSSKASSIYGGAQSTHTKKNNNYHHFQPKQYNVNTYSDCSSSQNQSSYKQKQSQYGQPKYQFTVNSTNDNQSYTHIKTNAKHNKNTAVAMNASQQHKGAQSHNNQQQQYSYKNQQHSHKQGKQGQASYQQVQKAVVVQEEPQQLIDESNKPDGVVRLQSECLAESGTFKFQSGQNTFRTNADPQPIITQPVFKNKNHKKGQDWESGSIADTATVTSLNPADLSLGQIEESKQVPNFDLDEHVDTLASNQPQNAAIFAQNINLEQQQHQQDHHNKQFQSQRYQPLGEDLAPPQVQSPFSNLSTQAQSFTPKGYNKFSFGSQYNTNNKRQSQYAALGLCEGQRDEHVPFMALNSTATATPTNGSIITPNKGSHGGFNRHYPKPTYSTSQVHSNYNQGGHVAAGSQSKVIIGNGTSYGNAADNLNYKTPPQVVKKQSSTSLQSQGTAGGQKRQQNMQNQQQVHNHNRTNQKHQGNYRQPGRTAQYSSQMSLPLQSTIEHQPQNVSTPSNHQQYYYKSPTAALHQVPHHHQQQPYLDFQGASHYPHPQQQFGEQPFQTYQGLNPPPPLIMQSPQMHQQYSPSLNCNSGQQPYRSTGSMIELVDLSSQIGGMHHHGHAHHQLRQVLQEIQGRGGWDTIMGAPLGDGFSSAPPMIDFQPTFNISNQGFNPMMPPHHAILENAFFNSLDKEIYQYVSQIKEKIEVLKPERDFVFEKILQAIGAIYQGQTPKLLLFGSLSTGLALESSDMDLAVTGLYLPDKYVMTQEMQKLADVLQKWDFVENFKYIDTATVPVIKMKINLPSLRTQEMVEKEDGDFEKRTISDVTRLLSIDITFDDTQEMTPSQDLYGVPSQQKTHLGIQSCALVKYYTENYPHLKEVAILLKQFMAAHALNSPYYGGISAYSTILILVAYMNYFGLATLQGMSPSRLLVGFLEFYGTYFVPSSLGVSVANEGSFYQLIGLQDSNIVILDPLNVQNNTTRNSYHTKDILHRFRTAFNNFKDLIFSHPLLSQPSTIGQNMSPHNHNAPYNQYQVQNNYSEDIPYEMNSLNQSQQFYDKNTASLGGLINNSGDKTAPSISATQQDNHSFYNQKATLEEPFAGVEQFFSNTNLLEIFYSKATPTASEVTTPTLSIGGSPQLTAHNSLNGAPPLQQSHSHQPAITNHNIYSNQITSPKC